MKRNPKYYLNVIYQGYDGSFDRQLETLLNRESSGSGYGADGRDISFDYVRLDAATHAYAKLRKMKKNKLRVELWQYANGDQWRPIKIK